MTMKTLRVVCLSACLAWSATLHAENTPAFRHDRLNIFPAAAAAVAGRTIAVDGDISEWKPEAFVTMARLPDTLEIYSLKIALAYDAEGILLAARVKDNTPMQNRISPLGQPDKGWAGDALQLRFVADPAVRMGMSRNEFNANPELNRKVTHLTLWYSAPEDLPALQSVHGWNFVDAAIRTGKESGLAYRRGDGAYTFEGRIPWSVLRTQQPLEPGQSCILTLQALWGGAGVNNLAHDFYESVCDEGFAYQSPHCWGQGYFVRPDEVAAKFAEQAAFDRKLWQKPEAAAAVSVPVAYENPAKGFVSLAVCKPDGQIVRTLLAKAPREGGKLTEAWDGRDDDGALVPPGSYTIKGLAHPGLTPRFVTSVMNSGNPPWTTADGTGGWSGDHAPPIGAACAADGRTFLLWAFNELGSGVQAVDPAGKKLWGGYLDWGVFDGSYQATAYDPDHDLLYVAMDGAGKAAKARGGFYAFNAKTGQRAQLPWGADKVQVTEWDKTLLDAKDLRQSANLTALAVSADRIFCSLYLENTIVSLDKKTGGRVAAWDVPRPQGLAYDAARQRLYAVSGEGVVRLDVAAAQPMPQPFVASLDAPRGLALDKAGNLAVSLGGKAMQVQLFTPDGTLQKKIGRDGGRPLLGTFQPDGMLNPAGIAIDPQNRLWVMEADNSPKRQSLWDLATGTLVRDFYGNCEYSVCMAADPDKPEQVYLHGCRFIVDYDTGAWRPDATVSRELHGFSHNTFQIARYEGRTFAYDGRGGVYAADGDVFQLLAPRIPGSQRAYNGGDFYQGAVFILNGRIFRPTGLTAEGVPVYPAPEQAHAVSWAKDLPPHRRELVPSLESGWKDFYTLASEDYRDNIRSGLGKQGVYRFTEGGAVKWRYARAVIDFGLKSVPGRIGDLNGVNHIAGPVSLPDENGGELIAGICYWSFIGLLNEDGLFVDQIGEDMRVGPTPGPQQAFTESWSGFFFRHPKSGKVYLFNGDVDGRIWEIQGWEKIRRLAPTTVTVSDEQIARLQAATPVEKAAQAVNEVVVGKASPAMDPKLSGWDKAAFVDIDLQDGTRAEAALAYDATNLYACVKVPDASPWRNAATDWRYLFKGGDAIDIQLGAAPKAGPLAAGDVRIVIAPSGTPGEVTVVGMWGQPPAGVTPVPQLYKSPVRAVNFGHLALIPGARVKVETTATGYTLQAAIAWKDLGLAAPAAGTTHRGDIGVLRSDAGGQRTVLRRFLFNQHTAVTMDAPTEAEIEPQYWGLLKFAP